MTPEQFVSNWANTQLKETASYITHFDDLCELLGHSKPAHMDKTGETFTYQKGVHKAGAALAFPRAAKKKKSRKPHAETLPLLGNIPPAEKADESRRRFAGVLRNGGMRIL